MALAVCFIIPAAAQPAASNLGFKVGEGRLHPFLEVDGRYDSVVGFFGQNIGDFVLHARPGVRFDLHTTSTDVKFNGSAEGLLFLGAFDPSTRALSRFQASVGVDTAFLKDGPVEIQLGDTFTRSDRTQNPAVGIGVISWFNTVRLAVPIHPGGKALEVTPRVAWTVEFFSPLLVGDVSDVPGCQPGNIQCDPSLTSQLNYSNLNFGVTGRWKFLPKTAVILDVGTDVRLYWQPSVQTPPATIFRAQAGLAGLISQRISVTLLAGYGGDFASGNLHTVIGQAELGWTPTELISLSAGYLRTTAPVPGLSSLINDRGYLKGTLGLWAGRLTIQATVNADYLSYIGNATNPGRNDFIFNAGVGPTVAIFTWWDAAVFYNIGFRISPQQPALSTVNYVRHEVTLRLAVHY